MLKRLRVRGFKSLKDATVQFPRMSVLFGPNSAGKSNLLEAIQALSRIGTRRTLMEALDGPMIRGYAFEQFAQPRGGIPDLATKPKARFSIEADVEVSSEQKSRNSLYRYRIEVEIDYQSGALANRSEYLSALTIAGDPKWRPVIEVVDGRLRLRRQSRGRPRLEELGQNYALLSDARLGSPAYSHIERVRGELGDWRSYFLDPRVAMRAEMPPMDVFDIGEYGQHIVPFLYKLKGVRPKYYEAIWRGVGTAVPDVSGFDVTRDGRGMLHFYVKQHGTVLSSRVASEGTLRLIALWALSVNPWHGSLLTYEEPENGVHPRRIERIARMLTALALDRGIQVVVTTHSPLFCNAVFKEARSRSTAEIGLFNVRREEGGSVIEPFLVREPLLEDPEIVKALRLPIEDHLFESLMLAGHIDE